MARRVRAGVLIWLVITALSTPALRAADLERSRAVVLMVYEIGLYTAELDRIMGQGDLGRRPASGMLASRSRVHTIMLGQRDAVLSATAATVAARATDAALSELLRMAGSPDAATDHRLIDQAVTVVKSSFEQALRDTLARVTRGAAEFPCTREQRSRCS